MNHVPGSKNHVPGTRNGGNPHRYVNVPGVPGVPGTPRTYTCTHMRMRACTYTTYTYPEHMEHPEQTSKHGAFGCSGYPEHEFITRNMERQHENAMHQSALEASGAGRLALGQASFAPWKRLLSSRGAGISCEVQGRPVAVEWALVAMTKPMRIAMPETAAFIDQMRDAFGADAINQVIRAGMAGQPVFHAVENGQEVGTKATYPADRAVKLSDMQIAKPQARTNGRKN